MQTPDKKPESKEDRYRTKENPYRTIGLISAVGSELAASILAGVYGGKWLDGQLGTHPAFLVTGLFLGLIGGFYSAYVLVRKFL